MKQFINFLSCLLILIQFTYSQNKIDYGKLDPKAPDELKLLTNLIGKYRVKAFFKTKDGVSESEAEITIKYTLNGYGISMLSHYWSNKDFYSELFFNYNPKSGKWVGASINTLGNRKTVDGVFRNDSLIFTQEGMLFQGRRGENKIIFYNITPDSFSHSFDSYDAAKDEWTYGRFGFTAYKIESPGIKEEDYE